MLLKLAERQINEKYPRMIARLQRELTWPYRAEDGGKISFGHYEVPSLVQLPVLIGKEQALINRRDRWSWAWSEKHLHQTAYYHTTIYLDTVATAVNKMAKALRALQVKKIVVKGNVAEARLLYRLIACSHCHLL